MTTTGVSPPVCHREKTGSQDQWLVFLLPRVIIGRISKKSSPGGNLRSKLPFNLIVELMTVFLSIIMIYPIRLLLQLFTIRELNFTILGLSISSWRFYWTSCVTNVMCWHKPFFPVLFPLSIIQIPGGVQSVELKCGPILDYLVTRGRICCGWV